jgi:low affinity Fe/Cu permease
MADLFKGFLDTVGDFIITIINFLITGVGIVLGWIVSIFPDSPFSNPATPPELINLGWITWLLPFPTMIQHTIVLATAVLTYYGIRVLARWVKLVKS